MYAKSWTFVLNKTELSERLILYITNAKVILTMSLVHSKFVTSYFELKEYIADHLSIITHDEEREWKTLADIDKEFYECVTDYAFDLF